MRNRSKEARDARLKLRTKDPVDDEERAVLKSIREQTRNPDCPRSEKICPECGENILLIEVNGVELDYCRMCLSCWFDPGELQIFSGMSKEIPDDHLKHRKSKRNCAVCGEPMEEYVFLRPYNLLVDRCEHGHGVYLQDREIERVFEIN